MRLYNTLSRNIQDFSSIKKNRVGMYHCGPTVYNFAHIGNLRAYVFADTIKRAFHYLGFSVDQVINITDVGHLTGDADQGRDKVEEEAKREKKSAAEIVNFYTKAFFEDLQKLNIDTAGTKFPKASEHIKEQISLIETLEKKGFTYKTSDGIYFDTSRFPTYGKLGKIDLANLEEGARVAVNTEKRNPTDFALWKFSPTDEKREQEWESPWGVGFPGWHLECSAMSMKYLGETFDIHTGGIDHIPVHHNNEIAQSESATGKPFANFWLHGAFVNISNPSNSEVKMSKSKENFIRLDTLSEKNIHPLSYRYWLLTAHYRSPVVFSFEAVAAAQTALESLALKVSTLPKRKSKASSFLQVIFGLRNKKADGLRKEIKRLIENDLDTPGLIALLHKSIDEIVLGKIDPSIVDDFDSLLGIRLMEIAAYMNKVPEKIKKLSTEREQSRLSKDWQTADKIRNDLEKSGFLVDDMPQGPRVRRPLKNFE